jgi:hypothetical protein
MMTKWEYKIETEDSLIGKMIEQEDLNRLGLEGWELVSVSPETEEFNAVFYFKRAVI